SPERMRPEALEPGHDPTASPHLVTRSAPEWHAPRVIRAAVPDDAPELGRVMVESFLAAHRGQMPEAAWRKRRDEWTPEGSARGWAGAIADLVDGTDARDVLLVAEQNVGVLSGLVSGTPADGDPSGPTAEIGALYVAPDRQGQGIGGSLLRAA